MQFSNPSPNQYGTAHVYGNQFIFYNGHSLAPPLQAMALPYQPIQSSPWAQQMLPPPHPPHSRNRRSRNGGRRRTGPPVWDQTLDMNNAPVGNPQLRLHMPPAGRAETIQSSDSPGPSTKSRKRSLDTIMNVHSNPVDDPSTPQEDSSSNTGQRSKRPNRKTEAQERELAACPACFDPSHDLAHHPYANTRAGYLVGCIIHNTYSHKLTEFRLWNGYSPMMKCIAALQDRPCMAPVYVAGKSPIDIINDAAHETGVSTIWLWGSGPYTPGFMTMLSSGQLTIQVWQKFNQGRCINDPYLSKDLKTWSDTQVIDPDSDSLYTGVIWPTFDTEWEKMELARLYTASKKGEVIGITPSPSIYLQVHCVHRAVWPTAGPTCFAYSRGFSRPVQNYG